MCVRLYDNKEKFLVVSLNIRQYNHCIKFKLDINVRKLTDEKEMNRIKEKFKKCGPEYYKIYINMSNLYFFDI